MEWNMDPPHQTRNSRCNQMNPFPPRPASSASFTSAQHTTIHCDDPLSNPNKDFKRSRIGDDPSAKGKSRRPCWQFSRRRRPWFCAAPVLNALGVVLMLLCLALLWYYGNAWMTHRRLEQAERAEQQRRRRLSVLYWQHKGQLPEDNATQVSEAVKGKEKAVLEHPVAHKTALLVIACNRPTVKRALQSVFQSLSGTQFNIPVIVSQDCGGHAETAEAIRSFGSKLTLIQHPDSSEPQLDVNSLSFSGYYKLARHYKWALGQLFDQMKYQQVIILEDDLEVSSDFFHYFDAFTPLLRSDPTLMCISAWNDQGQSEFVADPTAFHRTDFFPGLGWMLTRELWMELKPKWPTAFWDDWLRVPEQRRDRSCIRPEISRTMNFGRVGVSSGLYFDQYVGRVILNTDPHSTLLYRPVASPSTGRLLPLWWSVIHTPDKEGKGKEDKDKESKGKEDKDKGTEEKDNEDKDKYRIVDARLYQQSVYDTWFLAQVYQDSILITPTSLEALLNNHQQQQIKQQSTQSKQLFQSIVQQQWDDPPDLSNYPFHSCGPSCLNRYRIEYTDRKHYDQLIAQYQLMGDWRGGVSRGMYRGIVCFRRHLTPGSVSSHIQVCLAPLQ